MGARVESSRKMEQIESSGGLEDNLSCGLRGCRRIDDAPDFHNCNGRCGCGIDRRDGFRLVLPTPILSEVQYFNAEVPSTEIVPPNALRGLDLSQLRL
jgi:hypothetical protein